MFAAVATLLPAFLVIGISAFFGRKTLNENAIKALSNITFSLLLPALLFRSMLQFDFNLQNAKALAGYFIPSVALFLIVTFFWIRNTKVPMANGATAGLASTFSNTVQMGIPLTTLAFGSAGLPLLLSLIAIHALVILTLATVMTEFSLARSDGRNLRQSIWPTLKASIFHPVILPILAGLVGGAFGLVLPKALDEALKYLGDAGGPLCLVLLGTQLGHISLGAHARAALTITFIKLLVHPMLVCASLFALGVRGTPLAVLTTVAALPTGTNAFLFAQRYETDVEAVTASIAVSTMLCAMTYTIALTLVRFL